MKLKLDNFSINLNKFQLKYGINFNTLVENVFKKYNLSRELKIVKLNKTYCNYIFPFLIELQMKKVTGMVN